MDNKQGSLYKFGGRKNGQKETGKLGAKREKHLFLEMWKEIENIDQIYSCLTPIVTRLVISE